MASRNTGRDTGNGSRGSGGKSKWGWWAAGAVALLLYSQSQAGTDSGSKDYVPPGQHQTTQKKCDPNALFQFGCTP